MNKKTSIIRSGNKRVNEEHIAHIEASEGVHS